MLLPWPAARAKVPLMEDKFLTDALQLALQAAVEAGTHLAAAAGELEKITVEDKGLHDFVTEVDRECEDIIIRTIRREFPGHALLAEESGSDHGGSPWLWVVDPLDGTTNFIRGIRHCGVSIALLHEKRTVLGVIHDPFRNELFQARLGAGAFLGDTQIRVSSRETINGAFAATGFPFKIPDFIDSYLDIFRRLQPRVSDMRRCGSAVLDLAYTACGRFDFFWEAFLMPWDFAAGSLIVSEAGGLVSDFSGRPPGLRAGGIIAAAPKLHEAVLENVKQVLDESPEKNRLLAAIDIIGKIG